MKTKTCGNKLCAIEFSGYSKKNNLYCSKACAGENRRRKKIQSWLNGDWDGSTKAHGELSNCIKTFLVEEAGFKCTECGWDKINLTTGKCPLEVDHIDGDSTNNLRENLQVLCRNCHSLTPTFKTLNKTGRGTRLYRRKYDQFKALGRVKADPQRLICLCGKRKSAQSDICLECRSEKRSQVAQNSYPSIEEILEKVDEMGYVAYGRLIGKSDNAIRKYLVKNGVDPKKPKSIVTCKCGKIIEDRTYLNNFITCIDHRARYFDYPPVEEIIEGIQKHGWTGYAHNNGINHASNVRKYLQRQGVDTSMVKKN